MKMRREEKREGWNKRSKHNGKRVDEKERDKKEKTDADCQ